MNIDAVAQKLTALAKKIKKDKRPLEFLGLFLRDDSPGLWDIVIASQGLRSDDRNSFEYVSSQLRHAMSKEELAGLSRIVILDHGGAVLNSFIERFRDQKGLVDINFVVEGGAMIKRMYIILVKALPTRSRQPEKRMNRPRSPAR